MKFTALIDFASEEMRSFYVSGLSYTIKPGNVRLANCVERWLTEGKVKLGTAQEVGAAIVAAELKGRGQIT